jgi:hypothetical protein
MRNEIKDGDEKVFILSQIRMNHFEKIIKELLFSLFIFICVFKPKSNEQHKICISFYLFNIHSLKQA